MSLFYGRNASVSSALSKYSYFPAKNEQSGRSALEGSQSVGFDTIATFGLPLGIITKSHPINTVQGFQRIHDFALRDRAGQILGKKSRVCGCGKRKIDKDLPRGVVYNEKTEKAHINNVQYCSSVWVCKHCAKKITEQRKREIALAATEWTKGVCRLYFDYSQYQKDFVGPIRPKIEYIRGYVYMITLTNSHNASHSLEFQREGQKKAMKRFFEGRTSASLMQRLGKRYHITNYEVTLGQNGWHPHHHILVFSDKKLDDDFFQLRDDMARHWINCCKKSGLPLPSMEHGLDLVFGKTAQQVVSQYLCKWGVEHEMTKGHIKKGKEGGLTPFDLLAKADYLDEPIHGRKPSQWFREFAMAFKGARQLMWSRGLKDLFGLRDKSDEEILEETTQDAKQIDTVADMVFSLLVKYKKLAEYLNAVECDILHGTSEVKRVVDFVVDQEIIILEEMVLQSERRRGGGVPDRPTEEAANDCNAQMNIFSFG